MGRQRRETSKIELPIKSRTVILFESEERDNPLDGTDWVRGSTEMRTVISEDVTSIADTHTQWQTVIEEVKLELEIENTPEASAYFRTWNGATFTSNYERTIEYYPDGKAAEESKLTFGRCLIEGISYGNSLILVRLHVNQPY